MVKTWLILTFIFIGLAFGFGVIFNRRLVPSAFSLFGFLFSIAGIYASLSAHSATFAQVLLYVGGVMVLVIFVLFLNPEPKTENPPITFLRFHFGKSALVLILVLVLAFSIPFKKLNAFFLQYSIENKAINETDLGDTGKILASDFGFEFEMLGLLMLAALVMCGWYLKSFSGQKQK
jgi:NADH-quinone oxidoreductase subunit J